MAEPTILVERVEEGVDVLTMNRPNRLNAMTMELVGEMTDSLERIGRDTSSRVVILTGAGRGFCAGLDLVENLGSFGDQEDGRVQSGMRSQKGIAQLVTTLKEIPQPVIAAVNGAAAGGGLAIALAADVRVASPSASFSVAFIRIGLSGCDVGVSWLLPRMIGSSRANEMMLTGRAVNASEALSFGLVSVVTDDVMSAALDCARLIRANSPFGVWMTKEVSWSNLETASLRAAIDLENRTQILATMTGDMREAVTAWREKRAPTFEDR
ncbi:MAG TPA: enoyl-CoA hydratase-related protein [Acidimicrobiales bacterium]|nr:enoyl-CoA hydratase-related protein [Acidimicrobiales bacterium]